uniref:Reverse transcriptase n=1 Tax=Bubo bubo TaxID=30461 RepID=A0A8C0EWX7_BUBBB
ITVGNLVAVEFLVDTGVLIQGVMGKGEHVLSKRCLLTIGNKGVCGGFVRAQESPDCLLGKDLLQTLDVQLHLSPRSTDLTIAEVCVISEVQDPHLEIPKTLEAVPRELWNKSGADVGLLKSAQPIPVKTKGGAPSAVKQYPIPGKQRKIFKYLEYQYLTRGILKVCESPYNTPMLSVKKPRLDKHGDPEFQFVQASRAINQYVIVPVAPDPSTVHLQILHWAKRSTVTDLTAAFFSIPGQRLTWTLLVQYVDDLLIASRNCNDCLKDTIHLRTAVATKGHRTTPFKLKLCQKEVKYLGFVIKEGQWVIDPERVKAVTEIPLPVTKK